MYWLVAFGSVVVLLLLIACVPLIRVRLELRKLSPVPTGRVAEKVYAIRDGIMNFYIVEGRDQYIAIDSGQSANIAGQELSKMSIDTGKVSAVFLTHSDRDHVGALSLFKKATVYISEAEESLLDGTVHRFLVFGNKMTVPYEKIGDGETMSFGDIRVRSILTPGHTPGSMCYVVNDEFLFTGDTLSLANGRIGVFNRLFNMDTARQVKSFEKIDSLPGVRYILTAHHGFTDDYRAAFEKQNP